MDEKISYPRSEEGFDNRLVTLFAGLLFVLVEILGVSLLFSESEELIWEPAVFGGGIIIFMWLFLIGLFPSTHIVIVKEKELEIRKGKLADCIPYTNIAKVTPSTNMMGSLGLHIEYYKIDLLKPCVFGKAIHFQSKPTNIFTASQTEDLGQTIKAKMIYARKRHKQA